jgi:hypothetical protein
LDLAFFERSGDSYLPSERARGPWSNDSLHGRVVAGLCAHRIEWEHWEEHFHIARFTVDMFRLPSMQPLQIETKRVREGRRIRLATATVHSEGREIARASALMLHRSEDPVGKIWHPPTWEAPPPDQILTPPAREGGWAPMWETRPIGGETFGGSHRKRA